MVRPLRGKMEDDIELSTYFLVSNNNIVRKKGPKKQKVD